MATHERELIVDGGLSKLGREPRCGYDWDDPMAPWRVVDPSGHLNVVLTPRYTKDSQVGAGGARFGSETHRVLGTWSGRLRTDDGLELPLDGLQGFAEEAGQRC